MLGIHNARIHHIYKQCCVHVLAVVQLVEQRDVIAKLMHRRHGELSELKPVGKYLPLYLATYCLYIIS